MHTLLNQPSGLTRPQIEALAESLAGSANYQPGGDIAEVVENFGGKILIDTDPFEAKETQESIHINEDSTFVVNLPAATSIERDRFTIAHELGHYILHYLFLGKNKTGDRFKANRFGSGRLEWEANWFAASFLMPKGKYIESYRQNMGLHSLIASEFGVSVSASEVRAKNLNI